MSLWPEIGQRRNGRFPDMRVWVIRAPDQSWNRNLRTLLEHTERSRGPGAISGRIVLEASDRAKNDVGLALSQCCSKQPADYRITFRLNAAKESRNRSL